MSAFAKALDRSGLGESSRGADTRATGRYDATLFAATATLLALGTLFVFSSTVRTGINPAYDYDAFHFLRHHVAHIGAGMLAFWVMLKIPTRFWARLWPWLLPLSILLLFLVFFVGDAKHGARRWFRLFGLTLQPSEFVKVGFALYLAGYLAKRRTLVNDILLGIVPLTFMFILVAGLLVLQPDVGSVVLLGILVVSLLVAGGTRVSFLGLVLAVMVLGFVVVVIFDPEKLSRLVGWLLPDETRMGEGFHIYNSQIVIGTGGLFGDGLGRGMQHVLGYLPEAETDFLYAVASEELGFIGASCIVILYGVIALRGFALTRLCRNDFTRFLAFALTLLLTLPALVHMMVGLGIIPTKGLVLPFMSHGGSALMAAMATLGLLQRLHLEATARFDEGAD